LHTCTTHTQHIGDQDKMNWIRERVEHPRWQRYDKEKKQHIYERLCFADTFENFLANKFNTTKRFGLDGGEAIVPALKDAIDRASELGAHSFVIGMPHRGRLNILANVMRKVRRFSILDCVNNCCVYVYLLFSLTLYFLLVVLPFTAHAAHLFRISRHKLQGRRSH